MAKKGIENRNFFIKDIEVLQRMKIGKLFLWSCVPTWDINEFIFTIFAMIIIIYDLCVMKIMGWNIWKLMTDLAMSGIFEDEEFKYLKGKIFL